MYIASQVQVSFFFFPAWKSLYGGGGGSGLGEDCSGSGSGSGGDAIVQENERERERGHKSIDSAPFESGSSV